MKKFLFVIVVALILFKCEHKEDSSSFDRSLLTGSWKLDSTLVISGGDTLSNQLFDLINTSTKAGHFYDTLETWEFLIFPNSNEVIRVFFPGKMEVIYKVTYEGDLFNMIRELENKPISGRSYTVNSINGETLILSDTDSSMFNSIYVYKKVDSIEATADYYDRQMAELARKKRAQLDSLINSAPENAFAPQFPGGISNFYKVLNKHIKYPQNARRLGIEGTVEIGFFVDTNGIMNNYFIITSPGDVLSEAVITAFDEINQENRWRPGTADGKPVPLFLRIPVIFRLNN